MGKVDREARIKKGIILERNASSTIEPDLIEHAVTQFGFSNKRTTYRPRSNTAQEGHTPSSAMKAMFDPRQQERRNRCY